ACVPGILTFNGNLTVADNSVKWFWDFGNGQKQNGANPPVVKYPAAGNFKVTTIAVNGFGCADTSVQSLIIHPLPLVDAGQDEVICLGQEFTLQGKAVAYQWTTGSNLSCVNCANPVTRPVSTSLYVLNTTDQYGCVAADSVIISVKQPFTIKASLGDTLCLGNSLALFARGAELFTWSPALGLDNPTLSNPRATPQTTTTYMVIGRDNKSCFSDTAFVPVVVYPYPSVDAGADKTLLVGESIPLKAIISTDVTGIRWQPLTGIDCATCAETVARPKITTTYTITVTNKGRCESKDDITLHVICKDGNLFMPNTFSPNGDGNNDVFYPRGKGIYGVKSLKIFNRWGELVFQQYNFKANDGSGSGWNGKYKGRDAAQEVYVYMIEVICENNQVLFFKGDVTLVR
ncbi:MAG: gliding motility-associated C-terminal domain-containing protein, partial [Chitinophagaceae bacterium]